MTKKSDDLARTLDADIAALYDYVDRIQSLSRSVEGHAADLRLISSTLGVTGEVEEAASESLNTLASLGAALSDRFAAVSTSVDTARAALVTARGEYQELPEAGLDGWQVVAVTATKVVVPGVGTLAGDAAAAYWSAQNSKEREDAAAAALQKLSSGLDLAAQTVTVSMSTQDDWHEPPDSDADQTPSTTSTDTSTSGGTGRRIAAVRTIGVTPWGPRTT
ncbi:hypothetical protein [Cellulomonas soli]